VEPRISDRSARTATAPCGSHLHIQGKRGSRWCALGALAFAKQPGGPSFHLLQAVFRFYGQRHMLAQMSMLSRISS